MTISADSALAADVVVKCRDLRRDPVLLGAFGLGFGLLRPAPGTWGTLPGVALYWFVFSELSIPVAVALIAVMFAFGVWLCGEACRRLGVHDHSGIVFDEIVGYLVACIALPHSTMTMVAAFALFRLFDAWKPWPIRWFDTHIHGGFGVMVDDLIAGLVTLLLLHAVQYVFSPL